MDAPPPRAFTSICTCSGSLGQVPSGTLIDNLADNLADNYFASLAIRSQ
jgi:hypothetical protein